MVILYYCEGKRYEIFGTICPIIINAANSMKLYWNNLILHSL